MKSDHEILADTFPFTRTSHYDTAANTITLFYHHKGGEALDTDLDRIMHGFIKDVPHSSYLFRLVNERAWPIVESHFPAKGRTGCLQETFDLRSVITAKRLMANFDARAKAVIGALRELFAAEMAKLMEAGKEESGRREGMKKNLAYWREDQEF